LDSRELIRFPFFPFFQALTTYEDLKDHPVLKKLQRNDPYYKRNEAKICSFYVKGTCNRGELCPFRHEMPRHDAGSAMAKQTIQARYTGKNDPVANLILAKVRMIFSRKWFFQAEEKFKIVHPEDMTVTRVWVGGVYGNGETYSRIGH
jgi:pre-mRNA-splicing factor RBM22/SLT11